MRIGWKSNSNRCFKADLSMRCIWLLRGLPLMPMKLKTNSIFRILSVQMQWKSHKMMIVDLSQPFLHYLNARTWSSSLYHKTRAFEIKVVVTRIQPMFWLQKCERVARVHLRIKSFFRGRTLAGSTRRLSCFSRLQAILIIHQQCRIFMTSQCAAKQGA